MENEFAPGVVGISVVAVRGIVSSSSDSNYGDYQESFTGVSSEIESSEIGTLYATGYVSPKPIPPEYRQKWSPTEL